MTKKGVRDAAARDGASARGVAPRRVLKPPVPSGITPGRGGYVGWRCALPYAVLL